MLRVDTVFARAIIHWHDNFQQAVARPNNHPHPPRSRRAWYNVDGLPMTPVAQVENPDLPKIQRQFRYRNLHARVPITGLCKIEAGAWESVSVINYAGTYSHVLTQAMGELHTILQSALNDSRAFAPRSTSLLWRGPEKKQRLILTPCIQPWCASARPTRQSCLIPSTPWGWQTYGAGRR